MFVTIFSYIPDKKQDKQLFLLLYYQEVVQVKVLEMEGQIIGCYNTNVYPSFRRDMHSQVLNSNMVRIPKEDSFHSEEEQELKQYRLGAISPKQANTIMKTSRSLMRQISAFFRSSTKVIQNTANEALKHPESTTNNIYTVIDSGQRIQDYCCSS